MRRLRNAGLGIGTALALVVGAELLLRLLGLPPSLYSGDPGSLWTLKPGVEEWSQPFVEGTFSIQTSSWGWRGPEPAPGAVLCLGDSTTFGWGVTAAEAWPAQLGDLLDEAVINGGVPGYSSHQGLLTIERALRVEPKRVILTFGVRDQDPAPMPDHQRAVRPEAPRLLQLVMRLRPQGAPTGETARVSPERYRANLDALIAQVEAAGAEARVLLFPMVEPSRAHREALDGLEVLAPSLPRDRFFAEDPLHLTAQGHAELADAVAGWLSPG